MSRRQRASSDGDPRSRSSTGSPAATNGSPRARRATVSNPPQPGRMILLLQAAGAVPTSARDLIMNSSTATKVVLVILVILSLVSWAILLGAGRALSTSLKNSSLFAREVERAPRLEAVGVAVKHSAPNAAHRLLVRALQFTDESAPRGGNESVAQHSPTAAASRVETLSLVLDAESL